MIGVSSTYTCAVLRRKAVIEWVAFEVAEDNLAEGVRKVAERYDALVASLLPAPGDVA